MRTKFPSFLSILVLGGLLAACGPTTVYSQPQPPERTMTVTGSGMVTLTPDIAYISIGVHTQNTLAAEAITENNTTAQAIRDAIGDFGIEGEDIQTTDFSIYPSNQYDQTGNLTGVLYMVDNTVYVTVRDLDTLGELLDASAQAGANTISNISFDVEDKTQALSEARQAAVENARVQADELAAATGVQLGDVQSVSYYDTTAPVSIKYARAEAMDAAPSVPVSAGSMQITTTVTIIYVIE